MHSSRPGLLVSGVVLLGLIAAITPAVGTAAPPSAEAFGRIPHTTEVELSPNGNLAAWEDNSDTKQIVEIFDLRKSKPLQKFAIAENMKLRAIYWADDETVLIDVSLTQLGSGGSELFRTLAADVSGSPVRPLLMTGGARPYVNGSALLALRTRTPKTVTMWTLDYLDTERLMEAGTRLASGRSNSGWMASVFEVDTRSGTGQLITRGTEYTDDWIADGDGQPVVRSEWEPERQLFSVLAKVKDDWREIHRQTRQETLELCCLTADGTAVVALGALGQARAKVWSIPLDGTGAKVLLEDADHDVIRVGIDRLTRKPAFALLGGVSVERRWLDAAAESRYRKVARAFPDRDVEVLSRSEDGQRVIAYVESPSVPPIYYLVDFGTGEADIVGEEYPALAGVPLGELAAMSYKARDGVAIPAFLTLPPGAKPERLPLIVLPHGGPEARDAPEFNWQAQFLATRGYAVFQPQFRGSTGFGEAYRTAGYRQWGGIMQNDVTDGVKALIEQGVADPRRVCIVGTDYGGYAALAGAAFTPELYACAVSINGIANLPDLLAYAELAGDESDALAYWRNHIGSPTDPAVIEKSPARAADKVRAPILLLHGADDTRVPISQSEGMARALKQAGKPHTLVRLSGEDHWLSRSETRIRVLTEIEKFLAANL